MFSDWSLKEEQTSTDIQVENAPSIDMDLRLREGATFLISSLINDYAPTQNSSALLSKATTSLVNYVMSDYNGSLTKEQILSLNDKKPFLPQPPMLAYWAEGKGFEKIQNHKNQLSKEDVAGKYVLTYYPPLARSWTERTTNNIEDTTNKHWYSHCKSSIYDDNGISIASSNPEAAYNDTIHDATVYVPEDSHSYVIDYQSLELDRADIIEGLKLQSEGINIMNPDIQKSIFRLKTAGLKTDDIMTLWKQNTDITNQNNIAAIEDFMHLGYKKTELNTLDLAKSNNRYRYNLQDNSCAIQPTAPVLYASEAKIYREDMTAEQAGHFRSKIGLYNIHNTQDYEKINEKFYKDYKRNCLNNFCSAIKEDLNHLLEEPKETLKELKENISETAKWLSTKTKQWAPQAINIVRNDIETVKTSLKQTLLDDREKCDKRLHALASNRKNTLQTKEPSLSTSNSRESEPIYLLNPEKKNEPMPTLYNLKLFRSR